MAEPSREDILLFQDTLEATRRGDVTGAAALSRRALDGGLEHPLFYRMRALDHDLGGRAAEAAADYRRCLTGGADDPAVRSALGLCLARAGQAEEGLAELNAVAAAAPASARAHFNRAWTLELLGRLGEAEAAYGLALSLDPADAETQGYLADLTVRRGDVARARVLAEAALAKAPQLLSASLALAAVELAEGDAAAAAALAEAAAGMAQPHQRSAALGLLGDALDVLDRPEAAFAAYAEANRGFDALYGAAARAGGGGLALARSLAAELQGASCAPPADIPGPAPVFILGFPRSGTTLLGQILQGGSNVRVLDEQDNLRDAARDLLRRPDALARLAALTPEARDHYRALYWRRAEGPPDEGQTLIDKLPMNILALPLIGALFPGARVLRLRRDPRDVVLSCFMRRFVIDAATVEFLDLARTVRLFEAVMQVAESPAARAGLQWHEVRYERLVTDFEAETRAAAVAAGVPWDRSMADFADRAGRSDVATPSAAQVARPLNADGVGRWRRYCPALAPFLPALQPWVDRFGYGD